MFIGPIEQELSPRTRSFNLSNNPFCHSTTVRNAGGGKNIPTPSSMGYGSGRIWWRFLLVIHLVKEERIELFVGVREDDATRVLAAERIADAIAAVETVQVQISKSKSKKSCTATALDPRLHLHVSERIHSFRTS